MDKPKYLYRYASADRAIQILRDRYVYLAPVHQLNDLFEASVGQLFELTPKALNTLAAKRIMNSGMLTREKAEEFAATMSDAEKRESFELMLQRLNELNRRLRKYSGIACFSSSMNNQRMWGHTETHTLERAYSSVKTMVNR
jgi:hypothetical protein